MRKLVTLLLLTTALIVNVWFTLAAAPRQVEDSTPDFSTANRIRNEVSQEVDWGTPGAHLEQHRLFTNRSEDLARAFKKDAGTVMCQGAAYYLHLKYLEAGFRSYIIGFKNKVFSHVMVLVEVRRDDGSYALVVQDPSFNLSYVDPFGKPMSIFELLKVAAGEHPERIVPQLGDPLSVQFFWSVKDDPDPVTNTTELVSYPLTYIGPSKLNPKFIEYRSELSMAAFVKAWEEKGYSDNLTTALFNGPLYVYKHFPMTPMEKEEAGDVYRSIMVHYHALRVQQERGDLSIAGKAGEEPNMDMLRRRSHFSRWMSASLSPRLKGPASVANGVSWVRLGAEAAF